MTTVGVQYLNVLENARHNRATEGIQTGQLEVQRGQLEVSRKSLDETARHNLVVESQTDYANRTNRISAEAAQRNAEVNARRVALDTYMYNTTGKALQESQTHKNEQEAYLADKKYETEVTKKNLNLAKTAESLSQGRLIEQDVIHRSGAITSQTISNLAKSVTGIFSILK